MFSLVMNAIFNYIRGDEYPEPIGSRNTNKISHMLDSFKKFLKYLKKILKYLFPSFKSASTFLFLFLLIDVILLEFIVYRVGLFSGRFYKVLSNRDIDSFWSLALTSISYIIVNAFMKSIKDFITNLLGIVWRKYITLEIHESYFMSKNFYYLQSQINSEYSKENVNIMIDANPKDVTFSSKGNNRRLLGTNSVDPILNNLSLSGTNFDCSEKIMLDNPDQRITQDVKSLCSSIANIVPLILISPFVIGWYGYQVSEF